MENIGLCKRDMAVLPQREALAASPFASLAFAQAILERNNTATGLYTPLHLIYAPEEAQAETPAPKVEVDLHLTLPAEKQSKAKQEAPGERVVESMTERMVERILRERFTMERSVIRQAAPTIQNFYHTSVRAALARREVFLQGPVAQAQAMAEVAAARQKAPEPVQLRYAQVLRRNQEAGLTASTRAPLERQAFPPAQTAAPKAPPAPAGDAQAVPAAPAGDAQAVPAQAARAQTPRAKGVGRRSSRPRRPRPAGAAHPKPARPPVGTGRGGSEHGCQPCGPAGAGHGAAGSAAGDASQPAHCPGGYPRRSAGPDAGPIGALSPGGCTGGGAGPGHPRAAQLQPDQPGDHDLPAGGPRGR